mmetsp:Transcript_2729/g.6565  ORF Transcript_2729/g.6565 Transcript_2729/m.6565 type:complete len:234 (-) Transcript_2729:130-831(-)
MTWGTSNCLHNFATSTILSTERGAKQLVVVRTHRTFSLFFEISSCTVSTSVTNSSPTSLFSTTRSSSPAPNTHLAQVFWSILGHMTRFAVGFFCFRARRTSVKAMPVATGKVATSPSSCMPDRESASFTRALQTLHRREEPAAFGWMAEMSPDRPIPCARPKCLSFTILLSTLPSLSPTPALPTKLFVSIMAISIRKYLIEASSHPDSGSFRFESRALNRFFRDLRACSPWAR